MLLLSIRTRAFCYLVTNQIQPIVLDSILGKFWIFLRDVISNAVRDLLPSNGPWLEIDSHLILSCMLQSCFVLPEFEVF